MGQPVASPRTYRPRRTPPPGSGTLSLRKSSRGGAPCRCGCRPVGDGSAVGGFGLFGELALAFAVGALAVGVLGRQGPASGVALGAGAQFEGAELLARQRRALIGVVLLAGEQVPNSTASLRATATIAIWLPRRARTRS